MLPPALPYGSLLVKLKPGTLFNISNTDWPAGCLSMKSWVMVERSLGTVIGFMMPEICFSPVTVTDSTEFSTAWVAVDWARTGPVIASRNRGLMPVIRIFAARSFMSVPHYSFAQARKGERAKLSRIPVKTCRWRLAIRTRGVTPRGLGRGRCRSFCELQMAIFIRARNVCSLRWGENFCVSSHRAFFPRQFGFDFVTGGRIPSRTGARIFRLHDRSNRRQPSAPDRVSWPSAPSPCGQGMRRNGPVIPRLTPPAPETLKIPGPC
jgi:hypothetical protein